MDNRGTRSGRERSSPTWGHGCCGDPGWRKLADLASWNERPPSEFPPKCQTARPLTSLGRSWTEPMAKGWPRPCLPSHTQRIIRGWSPL